MIDRRKYGQVPTDSELVLLAAAHGMSPREVFDDGLQRVVEAFKRMRVSERQAVAPRIKAVLAMIEDCLASRIEPTPPAPTTEQPAGQDAAAGPVAVGDLEWLHRHSGKQVRWERDEELKVQTKFASLPVTMSLNDRWYHAQSVLEESRRKSHRMGQVRELPWLQRAYRDNKQQPNYAMEAVSA